MTRHHLYCLKCKHRIEVHKLVEVGRCGKCGCRMYPMKRGKPVMPKGKRKG